MSSTGIRILTDPFRYTFGAKPDLTPLLVRVRDTIQPIPIRTRTSILADDTVLS
ncbi:unnamed protein product [Penicillium salamii]|nr:unnamed protein product [Penicillium salamii]